MLLDPRAQRLDPDVELLGHRFTLPCLSPVSARNANPMRTARPFNSAEYRRWDGLDVTVAFVALSLFQSSRASADPRAVQFAERLGLSVTAGALCQAAQSTSTDLVPVVDQTRRRLNDAAMVVMDESAGESTGRAPGCGWPPAGT